MYIIGLNGPPHSGKDTLADAMGRQLDRSVTPYMKASLSMPMRLTVCAMTGLVYSDATYEETKDRRVRDTGRTFREMMISLSEDYVIPTYGSDFWGRTLVRTLPHQSLPLLVVIPDIGFNRELPPIIDYVGADYFMLVQLVRYGRDWGNDSRRYVDPEGINSMQLLNVENQVDATADLILNECAQKLGWTF